MKKMLSVMVCLGLCLILAGCSDHNADRPSDQNEMTQDTAYNIYCDLIKRFVPELMASPQQCEVEIKTRDEVTYSTIHFVRNTTAQIQSQDLGGKLQYCLLSKFPEANQTSLYCLDGDEALSISCELNGRGPVRRYSYSLINASIFYHINTPVFQQDAIKSFSSEKKGSDIEATFIVSGSKVGADFAQRVMAEILPRYGDLLDDIQIVLTIDENGVPKAMSLRLSMSLFNKDGSLLSQKTLQTDFTFKKFDDVGFDLQNIVANYTSNA